MASLLGIHDLESVHATPQGSWIVDTIALSESPQPKDYRKAASGLNVMVRANWGYGSTGSLPTPDRYGDYVAALVTYVRGSHGCRRWIIGNEPSLSREWPQGLPIMPLDYAACYGAAREAIHATSGHEEDEVLVAGSGPWNDELKYPGNERGDWVQYTLDCLRPLAADCDGVALHAYCHGYDPALASSIQVMDTPFQDRYYNFLCFQDYLRAFPAILSAANYYITEANGNGPWLASGLIPAMLSEVDRWNQDMAGAFAIQCLICYRFPAYDEYYMQGKADVMAEYAASVHLYETPSSLTPPPPDVTAPGGGEEDTLPPRDIDPRLVARGVTLTPAVVTPGQTYWRATKLAWLPDAAAQVGPDHHILGEVLVGGVEKADVPLWVAWPSGSTTVLSYADQPHADYNYDYPMSPSLNEYSIYVYDRAPSDKVAGIGMGTGGNSHEHTSTWITWEYVTAAEPVPPVPIPPLPARELVHPLPGAIITQHFYENRANYEPFGLIGHDGTDLAGVAEGSPIYSMAAGVVAYSGYDDQGYGNYVRADMDGFGAFAFYGHLSEIGCAVGQRLRAGDVIGLLGTTGNSTAAHLHLEIRLHDEAGNYMDGTPMPKGRIDPQTWCFLHGLTL